MQGRKIKKVVTNEDLARMVAGGFENVDKRFEGIDKRLDKLEGEMSHTNARLGRLETVVEDIQRRMVTRDEFDDLASRVKYIEMKLNIDSGK